MLRTAQILLQGGLALVIVAGIATYFFTAEPAHHEPPAVPMTEQANVGDVQDLLNANACFGCHAVDKKLVGPAFSAVAARYRGDDQAIARLTSSILKGSAERWGDAAMPAMPRLSEEQAKQLAGFVLQQ